ncbi:hypothetical protein GQ42DRAFT_122355 [Ramicandelaber brevisporus]|nr:hypothetical protein GQ42DRAFT_122355 [Ramicandelaber brevisporus]
MVASRLFAQSAMRTAMRVRSHPTRSGPYHFENVDGSHLPFNTKNKATFAIKFVGFLSFASAIPLGTVWWQLQKGAGSDY